MTITFKVVFYFESFLIFVGIWKETYGIFANTRFIMDCHRPTAKAMPIVMEIGVILNSLPQGAESRLITC